jgi:hypothetical protein
MNILRRISVLAAALVLMAAVSCKRVEYVSHPDWAPDVREALNDFIDECKGKENAYVVFDFDNTCSIFDISEQLMIYQLRHMAFELSPEEFRNMAYSHTEEADSEVLEAVESVASKYSELYGKYGPFTYKGVSDSTMNMLSEDLLWKDFAIDMAKMYDLMSNCMSIDEAYIWVVGWFAGMTEPQLYDLALASHTEYSSVETSRGEWKGTSKTHTWIDGIQVSENIRELWKAFSDNGIDVWVCSASFVQPVKAAVDFFGLHDYCKGVIAMTMSVDSTGRMTTEYDYENGYPELALPDGAWKKDLVPTRTKTSEQGKVTSIMNVLYPRYDGGPLAGFMDATGDYYFCTEFASLKLAVCFNRASRKVTDGGGLIAETAIFERDVLGYDLKKANSNGDILYVLQGRDENGHRALRPSNYTLRFGETEEKLFAGEENSKELDWFKSKSLTVKEILDSFCIRTSADNPLGFAYGFTDTYPGYRSIQ